MKWMFSLVMAVMAMMTMAAAGAQPLRVVSEFAKIDEAGEVVAPETPREILSPAIARNAYSSYQVIVQVAQGTKWLLYIGQNPEDFVKVAAYRRSGDHLDPIRLPYDGEGTQVVWIDVWADATVAARRTKLEPQVRIDGEWVIYPMEVRIRENVVPANVLKEDGTAHPMEVMRGFLCGQKVAASASPQLTVTRLLFRNAQQDVGLAAAGSALDREELKKRMGGCNAKLPADPEAYLWVRDVFFTPLWMKLK